MIKLTLKSILGHKFRFALTAVAVILGVSFVVASFVLRDGLKGTFNALVEDINADIDVEVRGLVEFAETDFQDDPLIDEAIIDLVSGVDGVVEAVGGVGFSGIIPIGPDDKPLASIGPPLLGFTHSDSDLLPTSVVEGRGPGRGEFVMDIDTVDDEGFVIGESYDIVFPTGREQFTLTGLISLGDDNATVGAVITQYDSDQFKELTRTVGLVQTISVRGEDDIAPSDLAARIQAELPPNTEAVTQETVIEESQADFGRIIDIIGGALTGFALVSLLVASFLINNIFNITVGQRVRELALLRAVGATTTQIRQSVVGEAFVIGIVASTIGVLTGSALALGIRGLMNAGGFGFPAFGVTMSVSTVVIAFVVGVCVTMVASLLPAFQAGRVPPVAAMQEGYVLTGNQKLRMIFASILTGFGIVLMSFGLFGNPGAVGLIVSLAAGAVLIFVGVSTFSPLFAAPVSKIFGRPLRLFPWLRVSGHLAQQNSARSARNTAAAAGALMIGLALVTSANVFGASMKKMITNTLENSIQADFFAQGNGFGEGFGSDFAERLAASEEFDRVTPFRFGNIRVGGSEKNVFAVAFDQLEGLIDPSVTAGSLGAADSTSIMLHEDPAGDLGVTAGDTLVVEFASGATETLNIAAVYSDPVILGNWVIDVATWDEHFSINTDLFVAAKIADDFSAAAGRAVIEDFATDFPQIEIEDRSEFRESQEAQVSSFILIINMMIILSLLIAILGIAITMTLAVFERTREIGLLRAVGMTRRQARSMIRWEAAIIALFGAVLGTVLGVLFGWAAVSAIPDPIVNTVAIPVGTLILFVGISAVAGLVAGTYPAWRAGRMNVLDAIAHF